MVMTNLDQPIKFHMHPHVVCSLDRSQPGTEVVCDQGVVWLTLAGDLEDHVLMPGEKFVINQGGRVVIEALREARLRICSQENMN